MQDKTHTVPTDPTALMAECRAAHEALAIACLCLQAIATGRLGSGQHAARKAVEILRTGHPAARDWLDEDPALKTLLNDLDGLYKTLGRN